MLRYLHDRLTVDPDRCNGRPTIGGHRITVQPILAFLAIGDEPGEILESYDSLELAASNLL